MSTSLHPAAESTNGGCSAAHEDDAVGFRYRIFVIPSEAAANGNSAACPVPTGKVIAVRVLDTGPKILQPQLEGYCSRRSVPASHGPSS